MSAPTHPPMSRQQEQALERIIALARQAPQTRGAPDDACISADVLLALSRGELTEEERVAIDDHLARCDACMDLLVLTDDLNAPLAAEHHARVMEMARAEHPAEGARARPWPRTWVQGLLRWWDTGGAWTRMAPAAAAALLLAVFTLVTPKPGEEAPWPRLEQPYMATLSGGEAAYQGASDPRGDAGPLELTSTSTVAVDAFPQVVPNASGGSEVAAALWALHPDGTLTLVMGWTPPDWRERGFRIRRSAGQLFGDAPVTELWLVILPSGSPLQERLADLATAREARPILTEAAETQRLFWRARAISYQPAEEAAPGGPGGGP